jgi:isocitrate dehydrogenase
MKRKKVTVIEGDGVGPEIVASTISILKKLPVELDFDVFETSAVLSGNSESLSMSNSFRQSVTSSRALLKGPTRTAQGGGARSLNVFLRNSLGLYANIRPVKTLVPPATATARPIDLVIVRENEEDLYVGNEYRVTPDTTLSLKVSTATASSRICRHAFEYARATAQRKVTCMTKDNIMKMTDGGFRAEFDKVASLYPEIESDHQIIDIGAALLATRPEDFGVVVTTNLYGDIISDIAAQVAGSVGLCGSANIGPSASMFEAIHGTAPNIAGQGIANPSGLLVSSMMMLSHLGEHLAAQSLESAWRKTLEEGYLPRDLSSWLKFLPSAKLVTTSEFTSRLEENLESPSPLMSLPSYPEEISPSPSTSEANAEGDLVGVDVFVYAPPFSTPPPVGWEPCGHAMSLVGVFDRGADLSQVTPGSRKISDCLRLRFESPLLRTVTQEQVLDLLASVASAGWSLSGCQNLYCSAGRRWYSV